MNKRKINTSWYSGSNHANFNEQPKAILHILWVFIHAHLSKIPSCCSYIEIKMVFATIHDNNKKLVNFKIHENFISFIKVEMFKIL